jgi:hypothetical protein
MTSLIPGKLYRYNGLEKTWFYPKARVRECRIILIDEILLFLGISPYGYKFLSGSGEIGYIFINNIRPDNWEIINHE